MDYLKWTTTLAGAAILWVGNEVLGLGGVPQMVAKVGLVLLLASMMAALLAAFKVLGAWEHNWAFWSALSTYHRLREAGHGKLLVSEDVADRVAQVVEAAKGVQLKEALDTGPKSLLATSPRFVRPWVISHVGLLVAGVFAYAVAQVLAL